jgi:DNA mismatch repair ATPase MutS
MALTKEYFELTKKYQDEYGENTILFMEVGSFFEIYGLYDKQNDIVIGSKITELSQICDLVIGEKGVFIDKMPVKQAGFGSKNEDQLDKYVNKLQTAGYTIVVHKQSDENKQLRYLYKIFSPGTYFSDNSVKLSNNTTCIWIECFETKYSASKGKYVIIGTANIDIYTGKTSFFQFKEQYMNNPTTYDKLENYISIYNPTEVLFISNLPENEMDNIVNYVNLQCRTIHIISAVSPTMNDAKLKKVRNCEKQTYQKEILNNFFKFDDFEVFYMNFYENHIATQAFCFLLDFIHQHNPHLVDKIKEPILENCSDKLILANHSLKQLNIIDDSNGTGKYSSVSKMLNSCLTPMGKRYFNYQFLNPTTNIDFLQREYNIIDHLLTNYEKYGNVLKSNLVCIKDLSKFMRQIILKNISPKTLVMLYENIKTIWCVFDLVNTDKIIKNYLKHYEPNIEHIKDYCDTIIKYLQTNIEIYEAKDIDDLNKNDIHFICPYVNKKLDSTQETFKESADKLESIRVYLNDLIEKKEKKSSTKAKSKAKGKIEPSKLNVNKNAKNNKNTGKNTIEPNTTLNLKEFENPSDYENISHEEQDEIDEDDDENDDEENEHEEYNANSIDENEPYANSKKRKTNEYVKKYVTDKNNHSLICTGRRCKILDDALPVSKTIVTLNFNSSYSLSLKDFEFRVCKKMFEYHKQTSTNNCIVHDQINELCKNITTLKNTVKELTNTTYGNIVENMKNFQNEMESICNFITLIDVVYNKATIAKKYNYCKPEIDMNSTAKSFVKANKLRHCLIEHIQNNELYVSNDICLGTGLQDGILLYGTNAVGKTSLIRALGISLVMAQSGMFVPCSKFVFKPYNYIFTRIIGNDNIFKGLSTFAVEMSELRTILRLADENSLILGDELCSGTENTSAISIFVAGMQKLTKAKSSFIFATHLHEIVDYEEIKELSTVSLKHMAVVYDREKDLLIYDRTLRDGPGNNMYGLEVCKSLKLPDDFIEAAYTIRAKYNPESNSVLSLKESHFNVNKVMGICECCNKNMAVETHHLQYQQDADNDGLIRRENEGLVFHKNKVANLMRLCDECHTKIHKKNVQYKKVKTTKGYELKEVVTENV